MSIEVLSNDTVLDKWDLLDDDITEPFKVIQDVSFYLIPKHPIYQSVLKSTAKIHVTTEDTDFILDALFVSTIQFKHDADIPTLQDLHESYIQSVNSWENEIMFKLRDCGKKAFPSISVIKLDLLKERLQRAIDTAYPRN
jgi:hypothetical protein